MNYLQHRRCTQPHFVQAIQRPYVSRECLRLNSLVYIHCTLLQSHAQANIEENARHLRWLLQYDRNWKRSLRMLQHVLVIEETSFKLRDPDLAWKSSRLVSVMEWLGPSSYESLKTYLLELLSGGRPLKLTKSEMRYSLYSRPLSKHRHR